MFARHLYPVRCAFQIRYLLTYLPNPSRQTEELQTAYTVNSVRRELNVNNTIYTVSQKSKQNYFCYNYVKLPPNLIIFGTKMANSLEI